MVLVAYGCNFSHSSHILKSVLWVCLPVIILMGLEIAKRTAKGKWLPIRVKSGKVVLLGNKSRHRFKGVQCPLKCPKQLMVRFAWPIWFFLLNILWYLWGFTMRASCWWFKKWKFIFLAQFWGGLKLKNSCIALHKRRISITMAPNNFFVHERLFLIQKLVLHFGVKRGKNTFSRHDFSLSDN